MNKKALKEFAIYARNELRNQIALRAQAFGITLKGSPVLVSGTDYLEINNKKYPLTYKKGLQKLLKEIETKGYENVIEEVAYTWFNRLIAIRYMEVHNYLPSRVRVLSSETKGKVDPDVLTEYQYTDLQVNKDIIASLLGQGSRDEAFRKLLIAQCNELSEIMPFLFEKIEDFTELLLPESLLYADSIINKLGKDLGDENFENVEVIGWLYQYYISEKKDEVFAGLKKNKKITKENIPAATQLFTPEWIVRYMVENSLGQLWLQNHPDSVLITKMKYYLKPVEQNVEVQSKVDKLNNPNLLPEDITIIDPACGSGHVLVYAFDLLYEIYEEQGYPVRDIPFLILEKNIFGIDIDDRAAQMSAFALMMKAREKTKQIFRKELNLNIISIQETNRLLIEPASDLVGENESEKKEVKELLKSFFNGKNYGSILNPQRIDFNKYLRKIRTLKSTGVPTFENFEVYEQLNTIENIIYQAKILANTYNVVVTNPPYMGSKGMNNELLEFLKKEYVDSKADISTVFMERCLQLVSKNGFIAMINIPTWMFISSFEKLRKKIIDQNTIYSLLHLGRGIFGSDFGTVAFVIRKEYLGSFKAVYKRFIDKQGGVDSIKEKEKKFFEEHRNYFIIQKEFYSLPGCPIAYWASKNVRDKFENTSKLGEFVEPRQGLATADNKRFLRLWFELNNERIGFDFKNALDAKASKKKWFPYNKGGAFRKWYGNQEYVINWENDGEEIKAFKPAVIRNPLYYFKQGITWSDLTSGGFSGRYVPNGFIFDTAGPTMFLFDPNNVYNVISYVNSKVFQVFLDLTMTGIHYNNGIFPYLPFIKPNNAKIENLAKENITISRSDWDSFELSWNYKKHPFMINNEHSKMLDGIFKIWEKYSKSQFNKMKQNEEEINKFYIELYGLKDELRAEVSDDKITVSCADRVRDAKSFLSYCIGLIMGRYSLDVEGLVFAGGKWDDRKYQKFQPDVNGIIPLTDTEYFENDVIKSLQQLLVCMFGKDVLAENLQWLADSLIMKTNETPVERLRRYLYDEFYADHCKIYQKRPIYWMVESGPKKGFRALFYLHRYTPETMANMRFSYVQNLQEKLRQEQKRLEQDLLNPEISAAMKKRYEKQLTSIKAQQDELIDFDKKLAVLANQRIPLDLDDGVVVNYGKLQNILAKIK